MARDERVINVSDAEQVVYWTQLLDINESALVAAVGAVGNSAQNVKDYLAGISPQS